MTTASEVAPEGEEGAAPSSDSEEDDQEQSDAAGTSTAENGGGFAVNINTAPPAVLKGLFDDRDVSHGFWDDVIEYRNLEEESEDGEDENEDPPLDENGEEIIERQFFENFEVFDDLYGWISVEPARKEEVEDLLTLQSNVFTIYVTARLPTQEQDRQIETFSSRAEREQYERSGMNLTRTVRSIVWRTSDAAEFGVIPLVRWEVIDYQPLEVLDFPDDDFR